MALPQSRRQSLTNRVPQTTAAANRSCRKRASCAAATYLIKHSEKDLIEKIEDFEIGPLPGIRETAFVAASSAAYGFLVIMLCLIGTGAVVVATMAGLAASAR